ncbi:hypothetical protein BD311DRAFT_804742 [Dichomitus squalens]|uniref:Uncharacterized protein n=1 Tax=Dichomitus squalens TaxID=114155 RepID=A0A4Q9MTQ1_9APHY|nr:hypothetical protein BD311DRAFT_804742 [Dichomitus squalens]
MDGSICVGLAGDGESGPEVETEDVGPKSFVPRHTPPSSLINHSPCTLLPSPNHSTDGANNGLIASSCKGSPCKLLRLVVMGLMLLRDDEVEFIDTMRHSSEVRQILATGERGAQARTAKRIHIKYLERFGGPLLGETDDEFSARRNDNKKAKRLIAEDEAACKIRKENAYSRILGVLKRTSQNSSRRRRPSEDVGDAPQAHIAPRKVLSTLIPPTSGFREFQASDRAEHGSSAARSGVLPAGIRIRHPRIEPQREPEPLRIAAHMDHMFEPHLFDRPLQ